MVHLKRAIATYILVTALLPNIATYAATYYVATNGNNNNSGTSSKPWRTVAYATSKMLAGDTTYVKGGTYKEGAIRFGRSGTSSAPIKLLNAPGEFPVIDCIDKTQPQFVHLQAYAGTAKMIGWITIEGFEIRNCYHAIKWYNLHDSIIRRNWLHHNRHSGILGVGGTRVVIDRNRINSNALDFTRPPGGHGIYANGTAYTVTNNLIYNNRGYGIQLNGTVSYNSSIHPAPEYAASNNWSIANNTLAYNNFSAGLVIWGKNSTKTQVNNNIFYENGTLAPSYHAQGINFSSCCSTGIQIRNNLAFASGSGAKQFIAGGTEGTHYTQSGNTVNTLHPKFVNAPATLPSSPNFTLASGSPAIDKGIALSSTKISYPGITRPKLSAYDVGAYEYAGSSTLAAPTSLQVAN